MAGLRELVTTRSHDYREEFEIRPNTDYTFTVDELYGSTKTEGGTESFQCNPASAQLTLTTGILFSRIPDRGYEARKVPGITDNQLVVEGNSDFRPEGVALLNYLLPYLDRETTGLALSAGPVVRFGSKSDVSTLGFFAGVSGHLYRRLYITPGFHFGEFADFPAGFQEGQAVPTDFGTLSPVKRWTTRFALGISFRTASFGGVFGSDEGGDKKKETVRKDGGAEGNRPSRTGTLTASARPDSSGGTTPASYDDAPADVDPSFMRTASLRTSSSKQGPLVTIAADSPLHDYTTFSNGSVFYLVLPNATGKLNPQLMDGRGLGSVRLEQSGSNLVISFIVPRGSAARVRQKFNRLEVLFTAEGAEPTGATVLAGAMRD
jgi:hypothetical protein